MTFNAGEFLILTYLKQRLFLVSLATFAAIIVGVVSTLVFTLVGPALEVLLMPELDQMVTFESLIGPYWGPLVGQWVGSPSLQVKTLWEWLPWVMLGAAGVRASLTAWQWGSWEWLSEDFAQQTRKQIVDRFLTLRPQARVAEDGADDRLASAMANDVRLAREYMVHFYGGMPRELLQVMFYLISLIVLSPILFAVFVLGLLPALVALSRLGRKIRQRSGQALDRFSELAEWIQQRLQGIETIKHSRTEAQEAAKLSQHTQSLLDKYLRITRVKARTSPLMEWIAVVAMVLVLVISFQMIQTQQVSGSMLMSFFALLGALSQSAAKLGKYYNSNREGTVACERLDRLLTFLNAESMPKLPYHEAPLADDVVVECRDLQVCYPGRTAPALTGFSYRFRQGRIYCICGPSGAGKSTLMNLLLGLMEPDHGEVVWARMDRPPGARVGYVPQNIQPAPLSLAANVGYPDNDVDPDRLTAAVAAAGLDLPSAVLTSAGADAESLADSWSRLSGGQAQRLMIARLFYQDMPVILFDEGTSALDPETEALVYESLRRLVGTGRTVIMIAHRLSALELADELLLLKDGRLIVAGSAQNVKESREFSQFLRGNQEANTGAANP